MESIGERIRARREELNMTQAELAQLLGYKSHTSVNKIEKNTRELQTDKIVKIAEALQTTPEYILGWNQERKEIIMDKQNADIKKNISTDADALEFYKNANAGIRAGIGDLETSVKAAEQLKEAITSFARNLEFAVEALIVEYGNFRAEQERAQRMLAEAGYTDAELLALRRGYYLAKKGGEV